MALDEVVNTFGLAMQARYGERVHKLAIDAGFTCPNRDGSAGNGGCTFCNNSSFSPNGRNPASIAMQIAAGRDVIARRTRAKCFLAYFQAYTNTYDDPALLRARYDEALRQPDVIGLSIGTRPDCVPETVLDLLCEYRDRGHEVWLELGVQSSFDHTLARVRRGHGYQVYRDAVRAARSRGLQVCTHLIIGLPGEQATHAHMSLARVLEEGVDGLKLHPLHVVKGTQLANEWRRGEYTPLTMQEYIRTAADLIERTPPEIIYHRVTGTVAPQLLLAPDWCRYKWRVLNGIERELLTRGGYQGARQEDSACLH
jgi:radical SAM protein (TIGR01212 family)